MTIWETLRIDPFTLWPNVIEGLLIALPATWGMWWIGKCIKDTKND